jgi:hypothetical protein
MRDVFCLATLVAKVLCLVVFLAILKTSGIGIAQATRSTEACKIRRSAAPACVVAAISVAGIGQRRAAAEDCSILKRQGC